MSIWQSKRRYEESRRFNERADNALLAIGMLKNEADGLDVSYDSDEIRSYLNEGKQLLVQLSEALENPEKVDNYTFTLAHDLCDRRREVAGDIIHKLQEEADILEQTAEELCVTEGLSDVESTLSDINRIATETSQTESKRFRTNLVN